VSARWMTGDSISALMDRAAVKSSGAGATITVAGERSGRHKAGDTHAGVSGACGKAQPPAARKARLAGIPRQRSGGDAVLCIAVVLNIGWVAPEKLDGKLFLIESHERVSGAR
jgi:hypothetical protein